MYRQLVFLAGGVAMCGAFGLASEGCSSDDTAGPAQSDAALDTSTKETSSEASDKDSAADTGPGVDASDSGDAGSGVVTYTVPAAGGSVSVSGATTTLAFAFPASAAGKTVTLTSATPASIGWTNEFTDVITLAPDGTTFTDPVIVKTADKRLFLFSSPSGAGKQRLEALPLAPNGAGFELKHFSSIAVINPAQSCTSTSGWNATANDPGCVRYGGANTTKLGYTCKALQFCQYIFATCCVTPGTARTDCQVGDNNLFVEYIPNAGDSASAAYCAAAPAKPPCGAITTTGGASANCTASMTVNGNVYVAECSSAGGQSCRCTKNGALGAIGGDPYTPGGDNCAVAPGARVANICNSGLCQ